MATAAEVRQLRRRFGTRSAALMLGVTEADVAAAVKGATALPLSTAEATRKALMPFWAALANRAAGPLNIVAAGDSTEEGSGIGVTAADRALAWPNRLGDLLRQRFPTVGEAAVQAANFAPINTPNTVPTGWTKAGTWTAAANYGPNANAARAQVAGNTLTYVIPAGTTAVDVIALGGGSISGWTFTIDGGAASATQLAGGSIRDGTVIRIAINPAAARTLVITTVGTNNYIHGLLLYAGNESKGIRVYNTGKHGSRAENWALGGSYNHILANQTAVLLAGVQSTIGLNPDLLILGWGINDYSAGVTPASYRAALENIIATRRLMLPTKQLPVLLLGKYTPNIAGAGVAWGEYRTARAALAAADPLVAVLELEDFMPAVVSAQAVTLGLYSDTLHPTAKGHQMIADRVAAFIQPS